MQVRNSQVKKGEGQIKNIKKMLQNSNIALVSNILIICKQNRIEMGVQELENMRLENLVGTSQYENSESQHKDAVISSLKKELFELKDLEHDFLRLNQEVATIESKYASLLDEKERAENEHKIKLEISKKNICDLRTDADTLKVQIHKVSVQVDDTTRENATLKRMCENRQQDISSLLASNRDLENNNQLQLDENRNLSINLKQLKEERNKQETECERLNKLLDESINTLKQLQKDARHLESSNSKLQNILLQAQKDHSDLLQEVKTRENHVAAASKKLDNLNEEANELKDRSNKLEKELTKAQTDYRTISDSLDAAVTKNKDMSSKIKLLEQSLRHNEAELDQSIIKREALRKEHIEQVTENKVLNGEIDKCLLTILEYEKINKELQKEVENYIEFDEEARNMLNRKQSMRTLLDQVNTKLQKTQEQIAHLR